MDAGKDTLYAGRDAPASDFRFTSRVAEVFDDMLERSVPFYRETTAMSAGLLARHLRPGDTVYDLGCSTGTTMLELARRLGGRGVRFIGVDNSPAMLAKARLKASLYAKDNLSFICADITTLPLRPESAGAVVMNYTLQFVRPLTRVDFVRGLHRSLRPGGLLVMSEKTVCPGSAFNRDFIALHHDFKRRRGYSELEIARKREALENVLIPYSCDENLDMLRQAGFSEAEQFFQWFNFSSFVARK